LKNQVVYQTNADCEATYENLAKNPIVIVDRTEKGLLWFRVKNTDTVFMLSPNGKLQVKWRSEEEKKVLFNIVKELLVPNNPPLEIKPSRQQLWVDYPPPENFKLYWCGEKTEYTKEFTPPLVRVPEKERRKYELDAEIIARLKQLLPENDPYLKAKREKFKLLWGIDPP